MFDVLHQYLLSKGGIPDTEFELIKTAFTLKKLRRKQYFLQEGDVSRHFTFVSKGCLRLYSVDAKGDEHIIQFALDNWWLADRESLISGKPSKYNIDALEDSELLITTGEKMREIIDKAPNFAKIMDMTQQHNFIANQNRIQAAISLTAEERYHKFIHTYPDIVQRVPQHMIASYLGITRETLSRIRKQK